MPKPRMKKYDTKTLGGRIRKARLDVALTMKELSERAEVSFAYLGMVERNEKNPSDRILACIADATGVSLDWLQNGDNDRVDNKPQKSNQPHPPRYIADIDPALFLRENLTAEQIRSVVNALTQHMDIGSAEDERTIVHALVDSIEIHPKPLPSGLVLKRIRFRIPLDWDGYDSPITDLDITDDDGSGGNLPSGGTPPPDKISPAGDGAQPDESQAPDGDFFLTENSLPNQNAVPSA